MARNVTSQDQSNVEDTKEPKAPRRRFLRIRVLNAVAILAAAVFSLVALINLEHVVATEGYSEQINDDYRQCISAARDLQEASDFLTSQVRVYVFTGDREYMDAYINELEVDDRRGKAVETLKEHSGETKAIEDLERALGYSNELVNRELYAMRLTVEATALEDVPAMVDAVALSDEDAALSDEEKRELATHMVLGGDYQTTKYQIGSSVNNCSDDLLRQLEQSVVRNNQTMRQRLIQMQAIVIVLLAIVVFVIFATLFLILWPMAAYTQQIKRDEKLAVSGADELRYLAEAYNSIYDENRERTQRLKHAAERDALTGLYNRGAYDSLVNEHTEDVALLLIDVDFFKSVNDTYGHETGDKVLKKVASQIEHLFRGTDYACRIGGDEFAVIMTHVSPGLEEVISGKLDSLAASLTDVSDGLPEITLSVGVAFSDRIGGESDLYRAADKALYVVKEQGRNGHAFFEEA